MVFSISDVVDPPPSAADQLEGEKACERRGRKLMQRRSRKAKGSTRYGLARAGMKSAPEQMAQKAKRGEAKGKKQNKRQKGETNGTSSHEQKTKRLRRLVREGTKTCEGKERKVPEHLVSSFC